jgi:serine protease Do
VEEATRLGAAISGAAGRSGRSVIGLGAGWGSGCGIVVREGVAVASARSVRGGDVTVAFADGRREPGEVLGVDEDAGLAAVAVATGDVRPPAWTPDAAAAGIGTPVVGLANPGGRGLRATLGYVAADQAHAGPRGGGGGLEHTAPLPRGSAGSALVDLEGRLLGINVARLGEGLCLALAATPALRERIEALARGEVRAARRLAVALAPAAMARRLRRAVGLPEIAGLLVRSVEAGGPAERAGLREGDLIVGAAGRPITRVTELRAVLEGTPPDAPLELTIVRGVEERPAVVPPELKRGGVPPPSGRA